VAAGVGLVSHSRRWYLSWGAHPARGWASWRALHPRNTCKGKQLMTLIKVAPPLPQEVDLTTT